MKKCKEQLLSQRKLLQEEEKEMEREYETMRSLSEQIKKVFISVQSNENGMKKSEVSVKK